MDTTLIAVRTSTSSSSAATPWGFVWVWYISFHLRSESWLLIAFTTHWNEKAHLDEKQKNFFEKISDHRIRAAGDLT
jgi:hypothetical protein